MHPDRVISIAFLTIMFLLVAVHAYPQDAIIVPVVPVGLSPILQWVLTVAGGVITVFIPILALWLRTYLSVQNTQARAGMINSSITRAAHLADHDMTEQHLTVADVKPGTPTMEKALNYIAEAYPDALSATPEASTEHLSEAVTAELQKIAISKSGTAVPSVILSPVSTLR